MINPREFNNISNPDKQMVSVCLRDHKEIFNHVLYLDEEVYSIDDAVYDMIISKSGIPKSLLRILDSRYKSTLESVLLDLYDYYYEGNLSLLLVGDTVKAVYNSATVPLLNHEFINSAMNILADYSEVSVDSYYYDKESRVSSIILYPTESERGHLGVLLQNDETGFVTCTRIVKSQGLEFYLPSKYYKITSKKYSKVAVDNKDALNLLLLRLIDDMFSKTWTSIDSEVSMNLKACEHISATYEEYRYAEKLVRRASINSDLSSEEANDIIEALFSTFEDFEQNYPDIDDAKKSYIWRCSALSDSKIINLVTGLDKFSKNYGLYPEAKDEVLHAIGSLIMLDKISTTLARRRGDVGCQKA